MTEDIKKKIEDEATNRFGEYETTSLQSRISTSIFKKAATFGYNLAEQEMQEKSKQQSIAFYTWRNSLDGSYEYALGRALTEEEYYDFFAENKFPKK